MCTCMHPSLYMPGSLQCGGIAAAENEEGGVLAGCVRTLVGVGGNKEGLAGEVEIVGGRHKLRINWVML